MANANVKYAYNPDFNLKTNNTPTLYTFENSVDAPHLKKKTMVSGFQYYLALFDSFIQRASGKYNFVNDETLSMNP
jgi:hypothetical protein